MSNRVSNPAGIMILLLLSALTHAGPTFSALTAQSLLGKPLIAAVRISNLPPGELSVSLAENVAHQRYGMSGPLLPDDTVLTLGPAFNGEHELRLTTARDAHEPVLSLVVRYSSARESGPRVFTALVNPERPQALGLCRNVRTSRVVARSNDTAVAPR